MWNFSFGQKQSYSTWLIKRRIKQQNQTKKGKATGFRFNLIFTWIPYKTVFDFKILSSGNIPYRNHQTKIFSVEFWMRHDLYNHAKISNRYVLLNSNNQNKEQEWKEKGIHVKTPHSILASLRSHLSGNKIYIYNKQ